MPVSQEIMQPGNDAAAVKCPSVFPRKYCSTPGNFAAKWILEFATTISLLLCRKELLRPRPIFK
jgi:hypothetical protein